MNIAPAPDRDPPATDESSQSSALSAAPDPQAAPQTVTCFNEDECQLCFDGRHEQNIVIRQCSDGTQTIIRTGPCGNDCE